MYGICKGGDICRINASIVIGWMLQPPTNLWHYHTECHRKETDFFFVPDSFSAGVFSFHLFIAHISSFGFFSQCFVRRRKLVYNIGFDISRISFFSSSRSIHPSIHPSNDLSLPLDLSIYSSSFVCWICKYMFLLLLLLLATNACKYDVHLFPCSWAVHSTRAYVDFYLLKMYNNAK